MKDTLIYPAGSTEACTYAADILQKHGFSLTDHPAPEITHLLLDVPSFRSDGRLRSGGDLNHLLSMLPQNVTVAGGNLDHPDLAERRKIDLLKDPGFLAQNAAITADCALRVAAPLLKTTFRDTPTLVLGWGRIGKCLTRLLKGLDCPVTVAARKEADRVILRALGYDAVDFESLCAQLPRFRLLFNTVPASVLNELALSRCTDCVKIELASRHGLDGADVVTARGLPGIHTPKSSGNLIADTFYRLWKETSQ